MRVWIGVNLWAQIVIIFIALITALTEPILALILAIPFGSWQVIAGIVFAVRSDKLSAKNRLFVSIYLVVTAVVLGILVIFAVSRPSGELEDILITGIAIASISLGVAFFIFSIRILKNKPDKETIPDILDQI